MVQQTHVKAAAFLTAPRYENTWSRNYIEIATRQCGIPLSVSLGVFYGQCMQKMFEQALEAGCDVGVTIDFDSAFSGQHIQRLLSVLMTHDHIDAVCAMQARRGMNQLLGTCGRETRVESNGEPIRLTTAHFGLTAFKFAALKKVQKPWFWSRPDDNGEWGDGKTDDDIWFWRQWEAAGNTVYMDTQCRIGHMEEMIATYHEQDGEFVIKHEYPADWKSANGLA